MFLFKINEQKLQMLDEARRSFGNEEKFYAGVSVFKSICIIKDYYFFLFND